MSTTTEHETIKGAEFSDCRTWRYALWRIWDESLPTIAFVGLNPSTADETEDDPTIRRCIGFAKSWGYGGLYMLNLFAFRATKPKDMMQASDPVGPRNDEMLSGYQSSCERTIAAWGKHGSHAARAWTVIRRGVLRPPLECLKVLGDGSPGHPLYIKGDTKPRLWSKA